MRWKVQSGTCCGGPPFPLLLLVVPGFLGLHHVCLRPRSVLTRPFFFMSEPLLTEFTLNPGHVHLKFLITATGGSFQDRSHLKSEWL